MCTSPIKKCFRLWTLNFGTQKNAQNVILKTETPIYFYTNEGVTSTKKQVKYKCMEAQTEKYNNKQK
jgi:hypothetical protein